MLWFAHDGSLNADWISHYAVRFALHQSAKEVRALFVQDGSVSEAKFMRALEFLRHECERAGVLLASEILPLQDGVAQTLIDRIPKQPTSYVLCGTRLRQRNFGFLKGTVSERLLSAGCFNVLALRIVQPGLLGNPRRLLLPVMGHPRGLGRGVDFIKLLGEELESIHVVMVRVPARLKLLGGAFPFAGLQQPDAVRYVDSIQQELRRSLGAQVHLDASVLSGSDPAEEIVLAARRHKSQLIYLGASERGSAERLLLGTPGEKILRDAPSDVAIYRGVA